MANVVYRSPSLVGSSPVLNRPYGPGSPRSASHRPHRPSSPLSSRGSSSQHPIGLGSHSPLMSNRQQTSPHMSNRSNQFHTPRPSHTPGSPRSKRAGSPPLSPSSPRDGVPPPAPRTDKLLALIARNKYELEVEKVAEAKAKTPQLTGQSGYNGHGPAPLSPTSGLPRAATLDDIPNPSSVSSAKAKLGKEGSNKDSSEKDKMKKKGKKPPPVPKKPITPKAKSGFRAAFAAAFGSNNNNKASSHAAEDAADDIVFAPASSSVSPLPLIRSHNMTKSLHIPNNRDQQSPAFSGGKPTRPPPPRILPPSVVIDHDPSGSHINSHAEDRVGAKSVDGSFGGSLNDINLTDVWGTVTPPPAENQSPSIEEILSGQNRTHLLKDFYEKNSVERGFTHQNGRSASPRSDKNQPVKAGLPGSALRQVRVIARIPSPPSHPPPPLEIAPSTSTIPNMMAGLQLPHGHFEAHGGGRNGMKESGSPWSHSSTEEAARHGGARNGGPYGTLKEIVARKCGKCTSCDDFVQHKWRKLCDDCKCPYMEHSVYSDRRNVKLRDQLGLDDFTLLQMSAESASEEDKHLAVFQLPAQDFNVKLNNALQTYLEMAGFESFCRLRDEIALSQARLVHLDEDQICMKCEDKLPAGSEVIFSDTHGNVFWHADCFQCHACSKELKGLLYCFESDEIYCVRHYGELHKRRCTACDELIFSSNHTNSKGLSYHMEHYNCTECETNLSGKRYVLKEEKACCLPCYEKVFANICEACKSPIGTDFKDLSYKGQHWHEECFKCAGCEGSLANQQFVAREGGLFCNSCYDSKFAQRCDKCSDTFKHGDKKYEFNGKKFHDECFTCALCKNPIGNNSFVPREQDELVCMPCYEGNLAQKCGKCTKILTKGGVTFRDSAFHKECFLCTECGVELANTKFATKDDMPYCPDCYVKSFAKLCEKCTKPIAGLGEATKYVAFEGRQWHADCFECGKCSKSLLGQGFLVQKNEVLCPECGNQ